LLNLLPNGVVSHGIVAHAIGAILVDDGHQWLAAAIDLNAANKARTQGSVILLGEQMGGILAQRRRSLGCAVGEGGRARGGGAEVLDLDGGVKAVEVFHDVRTDKVGARIGDRIVAGSLAGGIVLLIHDGNDPVSSRRGDPRRTNPIVRDACIIALGEQEELALI
jgi:hypothetical protein